MSLTLTYAPRKRTWTLERDGTLILRAKETGLRWFNRHSTPHLPEKMHRALQQEIFKCDKNEALVISGVEQKTAEELPVAPSVVGASHPRYGTAIEVMD